MTTTDITPDLKLAQHRHRLGMNQSQYAEALNKIFNTRYSQPLIAKWESGNTAIPARVQEHIDSEMAVGNVLAIINQKGGVGKTTTSINLAVALARAGARVLLIDFDPNKSASQILMLDTDDLHRNRQTLDHVVSGKREFADIIQHHRSGIDVVASHIALSSTDQSYERDAVYIIRDKLVPIRQQYDWILLDGPPYLGVLVTMMLTAADQVLIPFRPEPIDAMGLSDLIKTAAKVRDSSNKSLRIMGILPCQVKDRSIEPEMLRTVHQVFPDESMFKAIPDSAWFSRAAANGMVAVEYRPKAKGVCVYIEMATAMVNRQPIPLQPMEA
ncbi:ParA family protein [Nitrospirillum amazonense]|uniref:ParA family protein n=1 Tax=Nitrospirillum amazonense TaxID=28077 RepID=UPI002412793B|nr:ParA family protein [Nitrospirillum amazonense]MDG3444646.1 ParA family protein [Nitrospirillum amazonense]